MSTIEDLLLRDIAAVTKGVVVTETDLWEAREAVDARIETQRRKDRRRSVALVAAAAVVVAGAGIAAFQIFEADATVVPAGPGLTEESPDVFSDFLVGVAPTTELVDGFWRLDNGGTSMLLAEDGTVQVDSRGAVVGDPATSGTYTIDGDSITMSFTAGTCAGVQVDMRASLPNTRHLRAVRLSDSASACAELPLGSVVWEHVLPESAFAASFNVETPWQPLAGGESLLGDWFAEGAEHVLEIGQDGTYIILGAGAEPVDEGQWSLRGSELVLTSTAGSVECRDGDQLILSGMEETNPGTAVVRGTVSQNDCRGAWTPKAWMLVPNDTTM
jgi:hypothetical protein